MDINGVKVREFPNGIVFETEAERKWYPLVFMTFVLFTHRWVAPFQLARTNHPKSDPFNEVAAVN